MSTDIPDFYQLLGVSRGAAPDEISAAYQRLASEYEAGLDNSADAARKFDEIRRAYQVLSQPEKHAVYDELIGPGQPAPGASSDSAAGAGVARVPWSAGDVLKGVLLLVALELGVGIAIGLVLAVVVALRGGDGAGTTVVLFASLQVGELLMLLVAWRFSVFKYRVSWRSLGFRSPDASGNPIGWMAITVVAMFAVTLIYGVIVTGLGLEALDPGPSVPPDLVTTNFSLVLFAVLAIVVAPLAEETFFRGFVFSGLSRRWGFWWGAIISAALFAMAHASLAALVPIFFLGLLLAALYVKTKSLWLPIIAHGVYNGLAVVAVILNLTY